MRIKKLIRLAVIAGLYVALTMIFSFMSYGQIQIRLSEILILLIFFDSDYLISLTIGCIISNFFSEFGIYDIILGTFATFLSGLMIIFTKKCFKNHLIFSIMWPILFNGLIVGFEISYLTQSPFILNMLYIMVGESIAMTLGYLIFKCLMRNKYFYDLINQERMKIKGGKNEN